MYLERRAEAVLRRHLSGGRGVVVNGARQSGKTELMRAAHGEVGGTYVSLDDRNQLRAARTDPVGFVRAATPPLFIDEVQRGGDPLLLAVKARLDESQARGRVVMAGSTRFLFEPRLTESLAGRVRFVDLWPLSEGEIERTADDLVEVLFSGPDALRGRCGTGLTRGEVMERVCRGGFPEAVLATSEGDRADFFEAYIRTVTQRDILEMSALRQAVELPRLLQVLAARTAQELVPAAVASEVEMGDDTIRRYLPLLEVVFAFHRVPAWSGNRRARAIHRPKAYMVDTGLAAHLLGVNPSSLAGPTAALAGPLLETFVVNELAKQLSWSQTRATLHHWRDRSGPEVDIVIETPDSRVVAVEVKAAASVGDDDLRWLTRLRDDLGSRFVQGVVLACTDRVVALGDRLTLAPVSTLWTS